MPVNRNSIQRKVGPINQDGGLGPSNLGDSLRKGRYFFDNFMDDPFCVQKQAGAGTIAAPSATALNETLIFTGRNKFEFVPLGTASDVTMPTLASDGGLTFVGDGDTAGDGFEILFGGLKSKHPRNHVPSSEEGFFRAVLNIEDASGADIVVGFRKAAAYAATLTEYTDFVGVRILGNSDSSDASFSVVSSLNDGTDVTTTTALTTTGLEDATAVELEVRTKGGKAYFFINGVAVGASHSYTFDASDAMCPFIRFLHTTDLAGAMKLLGVEGGLLVDRPDATLISMVQETA